MNGFRILCHWRLGFALSAFALLASLTSSPVLAQSGIGTTSASGSDSTLQTTHFNFGSDVYSTFGSAIGAIVQCKAQFADGFPTQLGFVGTVPLSYSGFQNGGSQYDGQAVSFEPGGVDSFNSTQVTPSVGFNFTRYQTPIWQGSTFEDHTEGITIAATFTVDSAGVYHPLAGATIHFVQTGVASQYDQHFLTTIRSLGGSPSAYACFGQQQGAIINPDVPYPDGMASQTFYFTATCPGYQTISTQNNVTGAAGGDPTGYEWVGKGCALIMQPTSTSATGTAKMGTGLDSGTGSLTGSGAGSGTSTATCTPQTITPSPTDGGGGGGISNWNDGAFPATVTSTFLHSSAWTQTVTVPTAGNYVITGDCPTAGNIGTITLTIGTTAGTPVSCNTSAPGALLKASFGTFALAAGVNTLSWAMTGPYDAVKVVYITPDSTCGASASGSGTGTIAGLSDFVTGFWDKLKAFVISAFTPDPLDVQAVQTAAQKLFTWGPFGLPAQVAAIWNSTTVDTAQTDPKYWYFPLGISSLTAYATITTPQGYQSGVTDAGDDVSYNNRLASRAMVSGERPRYAVPKYDAYGRPLRPSAVTGPGTALDVNQWANLIPDHWDLSAYKTPVLIMRGLMWAGAWLGFLFYIKARFTPSLKV